MKKTTNKLIEKHYFYLKEKACWPLVATFILLLTMALLPGCERKDVKKVDLTATIKIKDTAESSPRIRIGVIPKQDILTTAKQYEPLAEYLSRKMKSKVTLIYLNSYSEVCDKIIYKQLDAAFFGSFNYALTHTKVGIEPVARPDYNGVSVYHGLVLVRTESGIRNVLDMKGKRLALAHPATYTGSLYPLYYFKSNGIADYWDLFSNIFFFGSHDKTISALLQNEADVAIAKDQVYYRMIKENPSLEKKLAVLATSQPVPTNALCVRKELEPVIKEKLKELLCGLDKDTDAKPVLEALGGVSRFVETHDEDYNLIYSIAKTLGIDLRTYPYHERSDI